MPFHREYKNTYHIIIDIINQPIFLINSSGINGAVSTAQRLRMTGACTWMDLKLFQEPSYFLKRGNYRDKIYLKQEML